MVWIISLAILMVISMFISSIVGKIAVSVGIVAIALLLLFVITEISFFIVISKFCLIIIVVDIAVGLLRALFIH